jgi:hypothetical protein
MHRDFTYYLYKELEAEPIKCSGSQKDAYSAFITLLLEFRKL